MALQIATNPGNPYGDALNTAANTTYTRAQTSLTNEQTEDARLGNKKKKVEVAEHNSQEGVDQRAAKRAADTAQSKADALKSEIEALRYKIKKDVVGDPAMQEGLKEIESAKLKAEVVTENTKLVTEQQGYAYEAGENVQDQESYDAYVDELKRKGIPADHLPKKFDANIHAMHQKQRGTSALQHADHLRKMELENVKGEADKEAARIRAQGVRQAAETSAAQSAQENLMNMNASLSQGQDPSVESFSLGGAETASTAAEAMLINNYPDGFGDIEGHVGDQLKIQIGAEWQQHAETAYAYAHAQAEIYQLNQTAKGEIANPAVLAEIYNPQGRAEAMTRFINNRIYAFEARRRILKMTPEEAFASMNTVDGRAKMFDNIGHAVLKANPREDLTPEQNAQMDAFLAVDKLTPEQKAVVMSFVNIKDSLYTTGYFNKLEKDKYKEGQAAKAKEEAGRAEREAHEKAKQRSRDRSRAMLPDNFPTPGKFLGGAISGAKNLLDGTGEALGLKP